MVLSLEEVAVRALKQSHSTSISHIQKCEFASHNLAISQDLFLGELAFEMVQHMVLDVECPDFSHTRDEIIPSHEVRLFRIQQN